MVLGLPYISLEFESFSLALGVLMMPSGKLVDISNTKQRNLASDVFMAPTLEGSSITYTRDGKIYVKKGGNFGDEETPKTDAQGRYDHEGIYSSSLVHNKSARLVDFKKFGLKAYKLTDELAKEDIDFLTIHHDGTVKIQTGRDLKTKFIRTGACVCDSGERFTTEITSENSLIY